VSESIKGALAVAFAATLWGTWKLWLPGPALDPATQASFLLAFSGLIGSGIALYQRRRWPDVPRWAWLFLFGFGLTEGCNSALYFRSIQEGDLATAVVTHYLAPVLVASAVPFVGGVLGRRTPVAAGIAFIATALLVGFGGGSRGSRMAAMEGAGSAVFYAAGILLSKRVSHYFRPWEFVGFHNLVAAMVVVLGARTPLSSAGSHELSLLVGGGLVCGTIAAGIYFYGLARIPAARTAVLSYMEPVAATLAGLFVLQEPVTALKVVAMLVIVGAGIAVATEPTAAG
jgi:drug/metabolite transporter (DMT)-like permease